MAQSNNDTILIWATLSNMSGKCKQKKPNISWRDSAAKDMILADLAAGTLPFDEKACLSAYYKELLEFKNVPYCQFKKPLKSQCEKMDAKFV